ncbi:mechanosensitive ion channel family protein [Maritalea sp.]|uniref:mechanosensitive ion channel family protein n=1 Tax=Maritalea sp. TaxID=2003361 RepID=UPI003EF6C923
MDEVDADIGNIFEKLDSWLDGFLRLLPNIGIAIILFIIFMVVAHFVSTSVNSAARSRGRDSLGAVLGSLLRWSTILAGAMLAITIVVPSIKPVDLFAGLGIGSVAIGFAFKDILQNMLAGILILLRQPFEVGDQIVSGGHEGTVEKIETRATFLKTYDGVRVVIPNSDIYTDAVIVNTAFENRRSEYDIGIGCNDDWEQAINIIKKTALDVEGVDVELGVEALPWAIADSSNIVRLRWWTASDRKTVTHTFSRVIKAVYIALDNAAIDMPYPTSVVLFHDQTEENDGIRSKQREGWPTDGNDPEIARNLVKTKHIGEA